MVPLHLCTNRLGKCQILYLCTDATLMDEYMFTVLKVDFSFYSHASIGKNATDIFYVFNFLGCAVTATVCCELIKLA